ncbi:MAG: MBL fold metallo-hydrolase [Gemmatimonadota bacterium]
MAMDPAYCIQFLGAANTVTGSRFLMERGGARLLVDCGLFQGLKVLRARNWAPFPVAPESIDAVLLTHAHLDHAGYLPRLVREGFRGRIHCTAPTADLVRVLLFDSARIQEEDARRANRRGYSRHHPAEPLYTTDDVTATLGRLTVEPLDETTPVAGLDVRYRSVGHILGASRVEVDTGAGRVTFSGDVGRPDDPVIPPPEPLDATDVLVLEGTYGAREHPAVDPRAELATLVTRTVARGGVVLVPAFAVGRAQAVLWLLHEAMEAGEVPDVPVYLDSPMAARVVSLYLDHVAHHRLSPRQCEAAFGRARVAMSVDDSKRIDQRAGPMVIVAGAGMLTGGRILHHLKVFGGDHRNTLILAGHQAAGTRGDALIRGEKELRIHGRDWPVRCEVARLDGLSAHADGRELRAWLETAPSRPRVIHLVHGEPGELDEFRRRLRGAAPSVRVADHLERWCPVP